MTPIDTPQPISYGGEIQQGFDPQNPAFYHRHTGLDSPKIDFNDLLNKPSNGGPKTATFVVGPSSNSDSASYDYVTDGTADDVEIQAAVDALPTNGGLIVFREGSYTLAATVTIAKNGVKLRGFGYATQLSTSTTGITTFKLGHASTQYEQCEISDLYFNGQNSAGTKMIIDNSTLTKQMAALTIYRCSFVNAEKECITTATSSTLLSTLIRDCYFSNWKAGVCITSTQNSAGLDKTLIDRCIFANTGNNLAVITGDNGTANVTNCTFNLSDSYSNTAIDSCYLVLNNKITIGSSASSTAIAINGTQHTVGNNIITFGASPNASSVGIKNCSLFITNNVVNGGGKGIYITSACYSIMGNDIGTIGHGIQLSLNNANGATKSTGLRIIGNKISAGSGTDDTYSGILIDDGPYGILIQGNTIPDRTGNRYRYGIREESGNADYSIIIGNAVYGGKTAHISTQGAHTEVAHNLTQ